MARSRIIKDLANSSVDTLTALKRAKVLLSELDKDKIYNWVNYEIMGYPNNVEVPEYRRTMGSLIGSYFKGSLANHIVYKNISLPLGNMPREAQESLLTIEFHEGVGTLKSLLESGTKGEHSVAKSIPADFYGVIAQYNNDPYMNITSARVVTSSEGIQNILSAVESKLLDVLLVLEKEFGNLDELDIDASSKSDEELKNIKNEITVILFDDHSIKIGDRNKITDSTVASKIKEDK